MKHIPIGHLKLGFLTRRTHNFEIQYCEKIRILTKAGFRSLKK